MNFTVVDLSKIGKLAKPITTFIEKCSNGAGILYEPRKIVAKAKAEVKASKIKAEGKIKLQEIQERARERLILQEVRKQENIEQIFDEAVQLFAENTGGTANVENLDEDWIAHFFKQCEATSNAEMRSLWARILNGEAINPGSFSRRTVNIVASLDRKEAELFSCLCQFVAIFDRPSVFIYSFSEPIFANRGINFETINHLESIGLVSFAGNGSYFEDCLPKSAVINYHKKKISLQFRVAEGNMLQSGLVLLTSAGRELFPICGAVENEEFAEYLVGKWQRDGNILSVSCEDV